MRKIPVLAAALIVPALPVFVAAPAYAVDNVICVGSPAGPCDVSAPTIQAAILLANTGVVADTIFVGPGTYTDGPYVLNGSTQGLVLKGSGPTTNITLDAGGMEDYINSNHATVQDLTVTMEATTSAADDGIYAWGGSTVRNVTIVGAGTSSANGIHTDDAVLDDVDIQMPLASGRGVFSEGDTTVLDSTVSGNSAYEHSGANPDTISRSTVLAGAYGGVVTDFGTVNIDNSVVDLGAGGGTGLLVYNGNNSTDPKAINADHVTVVGGSGSSKGVRAYAATLTSRQYATVELTNSIVRGPAQSLVVDATNDGLQGGSSEATINVSRTDYQATATQVAIGANGSGGIVAGAGNLDVDPAFVDAAAGDFHLSTGSPVIDKGDPTAGLPDDVDRDGVARVRDGDGNGSAIQDMGAFEYPDLIAPQTTITGGPTGPTRDTTPTFTFASDPGATFACQVDGGAYGACSSPFTAPALANGAHTFRVRATDIANNTDATAAVRSFKVDTIAPNTTITKKPAKQITTRRARFGFTSSEAGSRFQCRLDRGAWRACTSPRTVRVKKGKHVFRVRARDLAGNVDATPAIYRFRRV